MDLDNDIDGAIIEPQQPTPNNAPAPASTLRRATVEEVLDKGKPGTHYIEEYPADKKAGAAFGQGTPEFEDIREKLDANGTPWGSFEDEEDWSLAEWLMKNVGQTQAETFLKLPIVSCNHCACCHIRLTLSKTQNRTKLSFPNKRKFLDKINALPTIGPEWICDIISAQGDVRNDDGELLPPKKLELWQRDPVECIRELLGNPALKGYLCYAPEQAWVDMEQEIQVYNEMSTGEWWWEAQVSSLLIQQGNCQLSSIAGQAADRINNSTIDHLLG
jgi:hypothetical protein